MAEENKTTTGLAPRKPVRFVNRSKGNKNNSIITKNDNVAFIKTALIIRRSITMLLLKDFGIKDKMYDLEKVLEIYAKEDENEIDELNIKKLAEKYDVEYKIISTFPKWFLDFERRSMLLTCFNLVNHATHINSVYLKDDYSYFSRRSHIDSALSCCFSLLHEMQFLIHILPIKIGKLMPFVEMINAEIKLLKGLKKSDSMRIKQIRNTIT